MSERGLVERVAKLVAVRDFDGDIHGTAIEDAPVRNEHRDFARRVLRAALDQVGVFDKGGGHFINPDGARERLFLAAYPYTDEGGEG